MKNLILIASLLIGATTFAQPVITSNPQDASNCPDSCLMLTVAANGNGLSYQWQMDEGSGFVNMSGASATNDTVEICDAGAVAPSSIDYRCVVTDMNGFRDTSLTATVSLDSCLAPVASFTFTFDQANVCFTNTSTNANTVIWNFGDGNTDNSNNNTPCNDYGTAWYYDVTLYAYNDHGSDEYTMTLDLVGLEELSENFSVFPNPTNAMLHIQSNERISSIKVADLNGRILRNQSVVGSSFSLDVADLEAGVYTVLLEVDGDVMYHKMVKQ